MPEIRLSSQGEWLYIPGVQAFDPLDNEADPTTLPVKFALVPAESDLQPAEGDYTPGEWVHGTTPPTARVCIGQTAGCITPPSKGVFDVWMGVDGVTAKPRHVVAKLVVS